MSYYCKKHKCKEVHLFMDFYGCPKCASEQDEKNKNNTSRGKLDDVFRDSFVDILEGMIQPKDDE